MAAVLAGGICLSAVPSHAAVAAAPEPQLTVEAQAGILAGNVLGTGTAAEAYQNRLNGALQKMLDAVVGPGRAVVTTVAELDLDQVETVSTTYARDPAAGALSERLSSRSYTGGDGSTRYRSSSTVRTNALDSVRETRRNAPGKVKRLNVAVLVDATAGRDIDLAQLEEFVSVAAGVETGRGDTVAVAAMPMQPVAADTATNTPAESGTALASGAVPALFAGAVALLVLIMVAAARRYRRRETRTAVQRAHLPRVLAAMEEHRPVVATAAVAVPGPGEGRPDGVERQRQIGQLAGHDPGQAAAVLRGWTDSGR
ncbi:flagellar M-ring protein FliF C-terminal domain-containing protein [Actinoplanes sp. NPDC023801]|uniref:flagellar M-ring protein FliF C-terminal domain-containing protein n=1 Tax=Actinoplanes sp. NPDC023801 TaxID=3154595 RepID=UPI00340D3C63